MKKDELLWQFRDFAIDKKITEKIEGGDIPGRSYTNIYRDNNGNITDIAHVIDDSNGNPDHHYFPSTDC